MGSPTDDSALCVLLAMRMVLQRIVRRPGELGEKDWSLIMRYIELQEKMRGSDRVCQLLEWTSDQEFVYLCMELCKSDLRT